MENEQESSNTFGFSRDEIGHATKGCIKDRIAVMVQNERELYCYDRFLPPLAAGQQSPLPPNPMLMVDPDWRSSIVKWVSLFWWSFGTTLGYFFAYACYPILFCLRSELSRG